MGLFSLDYSKYPLIEQSEVERLLPLYRAGDAQAGQKIVEGNLRFVVRVVTTQFDWAWKNPGALLGVEDLIQEGVLGIYEALRYYDPARAKFLTYAYQWVRHAIQRALQIEVPREIELVSIYQEVSPMASEVFEVELHEHWNGYPESFTDPQNIVEELEAHDEQKNLVTHLNHALSRIPLRDAQILRWRFGLGCEIHSCSQIAVILGISRRRVYVLESRARIELREIYLRADVHIAPRAD